MFIIIIIISSSSSSMIRTSMIRGTLLRGVPDSVGRRRSRQGAGGAWVGRRPEDARGPRVGQGGCRGRRGARLPPREAPRGGPRWHGDVGGERAPRPRVHERGRAAAPAAGREVREVLPAAGARRRPGARPQRHQGGLGPARPQRAPAGRRAHQAEPDVMMRVLLIMIIIRVLVINTY